MDLTEKIKTLKLLKEGDFVLRSGKRNKYYIDLKEGFGDPEFIPLATTAFRSIVPTDTTCVAGMGLGGIPLATSYSTTYKIPLCLVREKPKGRGTNAQIEGYVPTEKDRVTILDDVFTRGTSIIDTMEVLIRTGVTKFYACVILQRETSSLSIPVYSALTLEDLTT